MRSRLLLAGFLLGLAGPVLAADVQPDRESLAEVRALADGLEKKPAALRPGVLRKILAKGAIGAACVLELRSEFQNAAHVDVFSDALRLLRHPQFESYLLSVIASGGEIDAKRVAFDRCAQYGSREIIVPFARTMASNEGREKLLGERTFVSLLKRLGTPGVYRSISSVLDSLDSRTRGRVLAGVASSASPDAQSLLTDVLGRYPELDLVVISGVARIPPAYFDERLAGKIRNYLTADDINQRREAAMVLGRWRDHRSIGRLLPLLEAEDVSVRKNAQWALSRITGLGFPIDHERWNRWYEAELDWWDGDGEGCLRILQSKRDGDVVAALQEIGKHNYAPKELAAEIFALLDDPNAEVDSIARRLIIRFGLRDPRRL